MWVFKCVMSVQRCVRLWGYSQYSQRFIESCSANQTLERGCFLQSTDTYCQLRYCRVHKQTNGLPDMTHMLQELLRLSDILLRSSRTACSVCSETRCPVTTAREEQSDSGSSSLMPLFTGRVSVGSVIWDTLKYNACLLKCKSRH